jgi:hypothetical protein
MPLSSEKTLLWIIGFLSFRDGLSYDEAAKSDLVIQVSKELNLEDYLKNFDAKKITGFAERFGQGNKGKTAYAVASLWYPGDPDYSAETWFKVMLAEGEKEIGVSEWDKKEMEEILAKFSVPVIFMYDKSKEKIGYPYEHLGYLFYLVRADSVNDAKQAVVKRTAKHILGVIGEFANNIGSFRDDLKVFGEIIGDPSAIKKRGRYFSAPG